MIKSNEKRKVYACITSLKEINGTIADFSLEEKEEILPLCQQMAVEIGNTIETSEGEEAEVISLLEKYCEEIYKIYTATESKTILYICSGINELLAAIDQCVEKIKEIPNEILFLPYKASMWDAMESVYQTAIKQTDCHVTVMPIPYYNVNPQGDILSVEYEGNLFPKNVVITDITDYDFNKMRPDAIFIHNPYDQYNYVTRVASKYYSTELVKYTNRLVYLPYFVASWNNVKAHFCLLPGVKNAWRTFVQSESIKKIYLQYISKKESIVALGSPKYDKVKAVEENLSRVPREWEEILANKKIFLLNTHLHSMMNKAEERLEKLIQIFNFFHGRENIALIWRPHPLSIETAKSLNPDFTQKYLDLIEKFKNMDIGIYDESADIHRAITVSDGYIGDTSSIIPLYGVTGKPIYVLGNIINIREKGKLIFNEEAEKKIRCSMKENIEALQYLYFEKFISLEYYIYLIEAGKDICAKERKEKFLNLQYGFEKEETAGERIWNYIYQDIFGEDNV